MSHGFCYPDRREHNRHPEHGHPEHGHPEQPTAPRAGQDRMREDGGM
jgi:hypothetical protein